MKRSDWILLGAGLFAAWWIFKKGFQPGINAAASAIAMVYEALTFGPPVTVVGTVSDLQGNVLGDVGSFPAAHDSQGNTYLQINGAMYQLGPRDSAGNFTAIPAKYADGATPQPSAQTQPWYESSWWQALKSWTPAGFLS